MAFVEQADRAEEAAGRDPGEGHLAVVGLGDQADLHLALDQNVEAAWQVVAVVDDLALGEAAALQLRGDLVELVGVEAGEDREAGEQLSLG